MNATGFTKSVVLLLIMAGSVLAQDDPARVMLGEITIKGEISQPSVSIISSRIQPEFRRLHVEKSFLTEIRQPSSRILELNTQVRTAYRIQEIEKLLSKDRHNESRREQE